MRIKARFVQLYLGILFIYDKYKLNIIINIYLYLYTKKYLKHLFEIF